MVGPVAKLSWKAQQWRVELVVACTIIVSIKVSVGAAHLHRFDISGSGILVLLSHGVGEMFQDCEDGSELISERGKFSARKYQHLRSIGR